MKIAIIGSGVSGLVCAHMLHADHELVVYEAAAYPGGHSNTVDVETGEGVCAVDTGFIVFNDRNYPLFERLLAELGVATQPSDMSFGVSDGAAFEYSSASLDGLFARRRHLLSPSFYRMIAEVGRFQREARALLRSEADPSLREWLWERRYSEGFVERLIVPQASAVWSADPDQMWSFPARFLFEFFDNHGMLGLRGRPRWRTVVGGSRMYVNAIVAPWRARLRLSCPVAFVRREGSDVVVGSACGDVERFDAVVFATHSDQALVLLDDPTPVERSVLGAIRYQDNEAVLHTDRALLPRRRRAWASWNYHLGGAAAMPGTARVTPAPGASREAPAPGQTRVTYHMNRLQSLRADRELCVTLNHSDAIDPAQIIRTFSYAHPVFDRDSVAAAARWEQISGHNRTHYCGAYWGWGFHEDGVRSAVRVAREIGARSGQLVGV